jgi:hypothetical protein
MVLFREEEGDFDDENYEGGGESGLEGDGDVVTNDRSFINFIICEILLLADIMISKFKH